MAVRRCTGALADGVSPVDRAGIAGRSGRKSSVSSGDTAIRNPGRRTSPTGLSQGVVSRRIRIPSQAGGATGRRAAGVSPDRRRRGKLESPRAPSKRRWRGEVGPCRPADPKIKASLYAHPGQGLLIIAGNFSPEQRKARIELNLAAFELQGRTLSAVNTLTDQPIQVSPNGTLSPEIAARSFVPMRLQ